MSHDVSCVSRPSLLSNGSSRSTSEPPDASLLSAAATAAATPPPSDTQASGVDVAGSAEYTCGNYDLEGSTSTVDALIGASCSKKERNPEFNMYKLPIEEQFNLIEEEFAAIEASTMNPRLYDFTTSNANPTKNRYINVLANEETIFPPTRLTSAPPATGGSTLSTSGSPPSMAAAPSPMKSLTSRAQKVWGAAGQRLFGTRRGGTLPKDLEGNEKFTTDCVAKKCPQWYINANVVDTSVEPVFVASQAPVQECIDDFLAVIYSCEVTLVLMLTEMEEAGFVKADRYWPEDSAPVDRTESFGSMCVYKDEQDPYTYDATHELVRRPFYIRPSAASQARAHKIVMYQYVGWPDRGVPDSTESFEELLKIIQDYAMVPATQRMPVARPESAAHSSIATNSGGDGSTNNTASDDGAGKLTPPVFVHCSAGIGRTGTLIGAYTAVKLTEAGLLTNTSIRRIVTDMRKARFGMVQRVEQYMFLYMIVLQHIGVDTRKFSARMQPRADMYNMRWMETRQKALLGARAAKR
ncbi:protein-tyrosine phosphatase 1-like protein [Leishmania donovani]|uniref:Protein-tyrosine phosphatase family protein n=1 Tax=Leishmania donovani TaxID=5661 RepID=A0A504X558_LEIDO|nr:Protein-tyrosine phosphatase family protein [Leishmania donovani]CAJ1993592.1 protein-tyrosine phosphatase 1-like protein [Leishmania donovani]VDZ49418.1 protein-tyrosine_phosphatase_1-like_protein/GeneDB:LmjF.36.2180 [Leishmania donovani]